ncbi:two-component system, NarL family, sensor histidine kinase BarA [Modicisalibacter muralis]|uniref:histidine kinase n=1 Tax=Modicisalibacter muralis TaxID=119000 RepID=A0A1G9M9F0_9GAMM|nr:ATP-binding protein [Halomonas muralis]SDL70315.1 two-component system, NarL family, sensor histidine kinase BarA [Halomonas muralis]
MSLKFRLFPLLLGTPLMLLSIGAIYLLAQAQANHVLAWPVIALLLSVLVALVVTYTAQRRLFMALEAQRQALLRFASGDYGYRPDDRAPRELVAFSNAMDALGRHLQHARENTRQQIEWTTRELQESMETIEVKNVELDMARRRALQGNRSKSEFLANMSHEIRTPLNGIIGFCRLLGRSHLDSRQREWLSHVETASNNLLTLINGILDVSKIEAGKLELESVTLDMVTLVDEVLVLLAPTSQQKGLQLLGLVYDDVPAELLGDPLRIKQVLTNLVHNAIKFTERGDVIVRVFVIDTQDGETTLRVKVSDTGIGLSPEVQKQLFQPFNQGSANRSRQYGGSGLGLTICKQLVEQMGGEISVVSQAGQGATFSFTLPLLGPTPPGERTAELQLPEPGIALCERHKPTRQALSHLLDNWGAQVRIVDEKQLGEGFPSPPELLIVALDNDDLQPSALARWGLHLASLSCPIVVLVNGNSYDLDDSMLPGASEILYKPVTRAQLARTVRQQLEGNDEPAARKAATQSHPGDRPRVLVVDDVASNRLLIGELLARQGIASVLAESGEQALALADDEAVDLVMMDIRMPGMSGVETLRRLRRLDGAWAHCPIVALTAHALEDEARALLDAGMQQVLTKPIDEHDLARVLEDYLGLPSAEAIYRADDLPVVDRLLGQATAGGSASLANDVLALLLDGLDNSEAAIRQARAGGDPGALLDAVHHLNGACRYCGVPQLTMLVDTLETRLRTQESGNIDAMLEAIFDAIQRLRDWSDERDQSQQPPASS